MVVYMPKSSDENRRAMTGYAKKVTHCAIAVPESKVVQLRIISFLKLILRMISSVCFVYYYYISPQYFLATHSVPNSIIIRTSIRGIFSTSLYFSSSYITLLTSLLSRIISVICAISFGYISFPFVLVAIVFSIVWSATRFISSSFDSSTTKAPAAERSLLL